MKSTFAGVSQTILWALHNRVSEAIRDDGILQDPEAIRIYETLDYDYNKTFGPAEPTSAVRSAMFDAELLSRNLLEPIRFEKVKSPKQPCFTIEQVERLLSNAERWSVSIFTTLAFTGMRIGELQQLHWEDVDFDYNVIHVHHEVSGDRPKDKDDRFIPMHPRKLKPLPQSLPRQCKLVFLVPYSKKVSPGKLWGYLKSLCRQCGFQNPWQYKLYTFRHFFASYCAQQNLSYKYVLEWMGHSSSAILDMYFTMNDRHAQAAMNSMSFEADKTENRTVPGQSGTHFGKTLPQPTHS